LSKEKIDDFIRQMAIRQVCPNSGEPTTPYERGAVSRFVAFGKAAIRKYVRIQRENGIWTIGGDTEELARLLRGEDT